MKKTNSSFRKCLQNYEDVSVRGCFGLIVFAAAKRMGDDVTYNYVKRDNV